MIKEEKIAQRKASNSGKAVKYFGVESFKEINSEKHIIEIKFAAFGNIDSDRDILIKGCFAKSIQERGPGSSTHRKIAFLWQHDLHDPIGKILKIEEREDGAYAEVQLSNFDAVPNAKRAYCQLIDGDIDQFSFGFEYVWDKIEYDEAADAFIVREVKLFEISVVTLGANEMTEFIREIPDGKSLIKEYLKNLMSNDIGKFNLLKQMINETGAEPGHPLTPRTESLFEKIGKQIN